jgi:hypothetical protein
VEINSHTNIILMSVPHRHDLSNWSCVKRKEKIFNRKLVKLIEPFTQATVIGVDLDRIYFTRQGLHLTNSGKERIALKIANAVTTILQKQTEELISLHWKTEYDDGVSNVSSEHNIIAQDGPKAA